MKQLQQSTLLLFSMIAFLFAEIDYWTENGYIVRYPQSQYFYAVGQSNKSQEAANSDALIEVKKQISLTVKSTEKLKEYDEVSGSVHKQSSIYQSRIRLTTEGDIHGIEVVETSKKKGKYYAFAILNKKNFASNCKANIREDQKALKKLYKESQVAIDEANIATALMKLGDAKKRIKNIILNRTLLSAAEPVTAKEELPVTESDIHALYAQCINELTVEKVSGDKQEIIVGDVPEEPFMLQVTANGIGVPNIPFVLKKSGKKLMVKSSGRGGMVTFFLADLADSEKGKHTYHVEPTLKVSSKYRKQLKQFRLKFSYKVEGFPAYAKVVVNLPSNLEKSRNSIEKSVIKLLAKYDIVDDPCNCITLTVSVDSKKKSDIKGVSKSRSFVQSAVSATFVVSDKKGHSLISFDKKSKGTGSDFIKSTTNGISGLKAKEDIKDLKNHLALDAEEISAQRKKTFVDGKPKIIVFPFKNSSTIPNWYDISESLTSMIITKLINTGKVTVLEREYIAKIMEEREFGEEEIDFAKYAGAKIAVVGTANKVGDRIEIDARIIDVERGIAKEAVSVTGRNASELRSLASMIVQKLNIDAKKVKKVSKSSQSDCCN